MLLALVFDTSCCSYLMVCSRRGSLIAAPSSSGTTSCSGDEVHRSLSRRGGGGTSDAVMWAVSEVVAAVQHKGTPVPYRTSKLTRYLQDTLQPEGTICHVYSTFLKDVESSLGSAPHYHDLCQLHKHTSASACRHDGSRGADAGCVAVVACMDADETEQACSLATLAAAARLVRRRKAPVTVQPPERPAGHFK
jgi:hypothetical protein